MSSGIARPGRSKKRTTGGGSTASAYTAGCREEFLADTQPQDAVIRNEIVGEAVRGVSERTRQAHPEIPWGKIAGTRDRVIHGYFRVDLDIVWDIVVRCCG